MKYTRYTSIGKETYILHVLQRVTFSIITYNIF